MPRRLWLSEPLSKRDFREYRQRAIFEGAKWDIQIYDHCSISPRALVVGAAEWKTVVQAAEDLARELRFAEKALLAALRGGGLPGLDRRSRRYLAHCGPAGSPEVPRLVRFDFHLTDAGWVISEANCDVPGGINEASHLPKAWPAALAAQSVGDPAEHYADRIAAIAAGAPVALVHATAFSDDWQLLKYLADALARRGVAALPSSPAEIAWTGGRASRDGERLGAIVRFFPGDWLIKTDFADRWFRDGETPVLNPVTSLLVQNKRFMLLCRAAGIALPAFEKFLPATGPISTARLLATDGVIKPAYGRVGEGIGVPGLTPSWQLAKVRMKAGIFRRSWLLQERFHTGNIGANGEPVFPCLGVYTLDDRVIGAYGRLAPTPLTDVNALDAPVFVAGEGVDGPDRVLQ